MKERQAYIVEMLRHIAAAIRTAKRKRLKLCVRPNGLTDIPYEGLRIFIMPALAAELSKMSGHTVTAGAHTIFSAFPKVQFVDYSKNSRRFERQLPPNYDLTFSRSETNESTPLRFSKVATTSPWYSPAICRKPGTATASLMGTSMI